MRDAAANTILLHPENEQQIKHVYEPRLMFEVTKYLKILTEIEYLKKSDGYKELGPCEKMLEVLKILTVERQAYHGKSCKFLWTLLILIMKF